MPITETQREGKILDFYDEDTGLIREEGTGSDYEFFHPGAKVTFLKGDSVIFLTITTPSNKVIVKKIEKKI
ncbi:MAG: hypothetical protein HYU67_12280 [Flavobacteriia bacterium]|nr:hypothetical protein [Flavobacteriia bacterium]